MLPDKFREDPKYGIIAGVVVVVGIAAIIYFTRPVNESRVAYICDSCDNEFTVRVADMSKTARPNCTKCGKAEGVTPNYHRCPACKQIFLPYRSRPADDAVRNASGSTFEYRSNAAGSPWIGDNLKEGGKLTQNRKALAVQDYRGWVCPNPSCKWSPAKNDGQVFSPAARNATQ